MTVAVQAVLSYEMPVIDSAGSALKKRVKEEMPRVATPIAFKVNVCPATSEC